MTKSHFSLAVKAAVEMLTRLIVDGKNGTFVTSIRRLALATGLTRRQVLTILDEFENQGLIERKTEHQQTQISLTNMFQLIEDAKSYYAITSEDEKTNTWVDWCHLTDDRVPAEDVDAIEVKNETDADDVPEVPHIYSLNNSNKEYSNKAIDYSMPPTIEDVRQYAEQLGYDGFDSDHFWHHHNARQWKSGKNKIKNWRSAVVTWRINSKKMKPSSEIIDL